MSGSLAIVGLIIIVLGWVVQLYISAVRRIFALSLKFVAMFLVGCIFLIIDGLQEGQILIAILYLACGLAACGAGYYAKRARP